MLRIQTRQYTPHALLLASAMLGLSFTISSPQSPVRDDAGYSLANPEADTDHAEYFDRSYMHAEGQTRSLAQVLAEARVRFERMRQNQRGKDGRDEATDTATPTPLSQFELNHIAQRYEPAQITPISPRFSEPGAAFVTTGASALPANPDALPQRTYNVLGYGDIGGAEPVASRPTDPTEPALIGSDPIETPATVTIPGSDTLRADAATPASIDLFGSIRTESTGPQPSPTTQRFTPEPLSASQPALTAAQAATVQPTTSSAGAQVLAVRQSESQSARQVADKQAPPVAERTTVSEAVADNSLTRFETVKDVQSEKSTSHYSFTTATKATPTRNSPAPAEPNVPVLNRQAKAPTPQTKSKQELTTAQTPTRSGITPSTTAGDPKQDNQKPLVVLVDDPNSIGSERVNAIDNALKEINQATKQAGIEMELKLTTDPGTGHNILLREDNNAALNGKLGLAQSASIYDDNGYEYRLGQDNNALGGQAVASINNAVNWFAGNDIFDIKQDQFDYQTAVTHELLHLLGLDDDFGNNQSLVMHGYLSPGETRRAIEATEKEELASRYAYNNLWNFNAKSNSKSSRNARYNSQGIRYRAEALTAAPTPEPASAVVMGVGLLVVLRRR